MYDNLFGPGRHNRAAHRHLLDLNPIRWTLVMLADLLVEVKVLLALDRRQRGGLNGFNPVKPLNTSSADISQHYHSQWITVDLGQWLAVHFPDKHDLVRLDFRPWNTHEVVHDLVSLEIGLGTIEFQVFRSIDKPTAVFDHLFQADSDIFRSSNCTFCPWGLRKFVSLPRVQTDLLYPTSSRALRMSQISTA